MKMRLRKLFLPIGAHLGLVSLGIPGSALFWCDRIKSALYYCSEHYPLDFFVGLPFVILVVGM